MKFFIAFLAVALSAANAVPDAVPVSTSVWPPYGVYGKAAGLPSWPYANNGWNAWNGWNTWGKQGLLGYPYANAAWSPVYGHNTVVQANLGKSYPYGLPWGTYGAASQYWNGHHGYNYGGYLPTVVPVSKQLAATPGSVHVAAVPVVGEKFVYA